MKIFVISIVIAIAQMPVTALACEGVKAKTGKTQEVAKLMGTEKMGERCMFDYECRPNERCDNGVCSLHRGTTSDTDLAARE